MLNSCELNSKATGQYEVNIWEFSWYVERLNEDLIAEQICERRVVVQEEGKSPKVIRWTR